MNRPSPPPQPTTVRLTVDRECQLTGATPPLLAALRSALTIDNPKYQAAKQFGRWIGKQLKPQLYFFREEPGRILFPRGFGNQAVRICRQETGAAPEIDDRRRLLPEIDLTFHKLIEVPTHALDGVEAVLKQDLGEIVVAGRRSPMLLQCAGSKDETKRLDKPASLGLEVFCLATAVLHDGFVSGDGG